MSLNVKINLALSCTITQTDGSFFTTFINPSTPLDFPGMKIYVLE